MFSRFMLSPTEIAVAERNMVNAFNGDPTRYKIRMPRQPSRPKRALFAIAIIIATMILIQGVSMAIGHSLFGYVHSWIWRTDTVGVGTVEPDEEYGADFENPYNETTDEFINIDFENIEDIHEARLSRVPNVLMESFEFSNANYSNFFGDITFAIYFIDENGNEVGLTILNNLLRYGEIEEEQLVEEIVVNNITFTIFRNMEDFRVIWGRDGSLYELGVFLPLETVKELIQEIS